MGNMGRCHGDNPTCNILGIRYLKLDHGNMGMIPINQKQSTVDGKNPASPWMVETL